MAKTKRGGKRSNTGPKKTEPKEAIGIRVLKKFKKQLVSVVRQEEKRLVELEKEKHDS